MPSLRARIVSSRELGANCWLPLRFFGRCRECSRYKRCNYPEKNTEGEDGEQVRRELPAHHA